MEINIFTSKTFVSDPELPNFEKDKKTTISEILSLSKIRAYYEIKSKSKLPATKFQQESLLLEDLELQERLEKKLKELFLKQGFVMNDIYYEEGSVLIKMFFDFTSWIVRNNNFSTDVMIYSSIAQYPEFEKALKRVKNALRKEAIKIELSLLPLLSKAVISKIKLNKDVTAGGTDVGTLGESRGNKRAFIDIGFGGKGESSLFQDTPEFKKSEATTIEERVKEAKDRAAMVKGILTRK